MQTAGTKENRVDSPRAQRMRLARELLRLREQHQLTQTQLSKMCGFQSRYTVQNLESGEARPALEHVLQIIESLGVEDGTNEWNDFLRLTRGAGKRGWWDDKRFRQMGDRQRTWADLELGASLRAYEHSLVPGLLQTEQYYRDLNTRGGGEADDQFDPEVGVAGRLERQRQFQEGTGALEVVIEEIVVQRLFVGRSTMQAQLEHLATTADSERIQVRVIPTKVEVELTGVWPPRSAFTLFSYPDPDDPDLVLLDGIEEDEIRSDSRVGSYVRLFEQLAAAALSPADSAAYFARLAEDIGGHTP